MVKKKFNEQKSLQNLNDINKYTQQHENEISKFYELSQKMIIFSIINSIMDNICKIYATTIVSIFQLSLSYKCVI